MKKNIKRRAILLLLVSIISLSTFITIDICNYQVNPNKNWDNLNEIRPIPSNGQSLVFGTTNDPMDLDPHLCWPTSGEDVISQICEGLYKFDVTDPAYPLLPILATDLPIVGGTADKPTLTFTLRQGVYFQDNTPFNATAAAWNFNRLMYFMNYSGNQYLPTPFNIPLPVTTIVSRGYSVFTLGGVPLINHTEVLGTYTLRLHLNYPKASFINILTSYPTFMHSPISAKQQGKELDYLTYEDDDILIGTGPFIYQEYILDTRLTFSGNPDYWQGAPQLENLTFLIIEDPNLLNQAVLDGVVDLCDTPVTDFLDDFKTDPDITLLEGGPDYYTNYMGFNGYMVNTTFRKAISYAINYSSLIANVMGGNGYRLKSPIPESIPMSNYSFNVATFDRAYAQSIMQSMGYGVGFTTDAQWLAVADSGGWPGTHHWNITAQLEGTPRRDFALYISDNLRYLGLNVPVVQIPFWELLYCIINEIGTLRRDMIPMYILGWGPDYIDPENYITPLYSNTSSFWVNTYDYELEQLMLAGERTIDNIAREAIYDEIQRKLVEELYFFAWIATGKNYDVYQNYVKGWVPNPHDVVDFYPVYIELEITPPDITIHSPTPNQIFKYSIPDFNITIDSDSPIVSTWYMFEGVGAKYYFSGLTGTINQTAWNVHECGQINITFYARDEQGNIGSESVQVVKEQWLFVEIVDQSFTSDEFYIEFLIYNGINQAIDFAIIEMWWDGVDVSSSVQNLGGGFYSVSLDPITVAPGDDPILLSMFVSAEGYYQTPYEMKIAVDPDLINKAPKEPEIPGYELLVLIGVSCAALLIFLRRIKKSKKIN
ncbi:MAG: ABC transporter substrate-binding protein [Promethearchaeota archaeon]